MHRKGEKKGDQFPAQGNYLFNCSLNRKEEETGKERHSSPQDLSLGGETKGVCFQFPFLYNSIFYIKNSIIKISTQKN